MNVRAKIILLVTYNKGLKSWNFLRPGILGWSLKKPKPGPLRTHRLDSSDQTRN